MDSRAWAPWAERGGVTAWGQVCLLPWDTHSRGPDRALQCVLRELQGCGEPQAAGTPHPCRGLGRVFLFCSLASASSSELSKCCWGWGFQTLAEVGKLGQLAAREWLSPPTQPQLCSPT